MGGRDLGVLFATSKGIPTNVATLASHQNPPFSMSKKYHREVKPDLGTLQQKVVHCFNAYGHCNNGKPPRPKTETRTNIWHFYTNIKFLQYLNFLRLISCKKNCRSDLLSREPSTRVNRKKKIEGFKKHGIVMLYIFRCIIF